MERRQKADRGLPSRVAGEEWANGPPLKSDGGPLETECSRSILTSQCPLLLGADIGMVGMRLAALLQDLTLADEGGWNDRFSHLRISALDPPETFIAQTGGGPQAVVRRRLAPLTIERALY